MRKAAVRDGDSTTTGGRVMGSSTGYTDHGKKLALDGDVATCGNCKGLHRIFGAGKGISDRGRNVVVDGDSVLCPCGKNRVIVGSNPGYFLNSDPGSSSARNAAVAVESASSSLASGTFDEQVRIAARGIPLKGYPYFIEIADGRTSYGRTDANGNLPRIETQEANDYTIYWGDAAFAKQQGI
ncbi:PAAR domain-containing protein [Paraburkholderia fungorum]|uniref:PAAR domain-containing protein n=1 Tax=Paraburkholderia fungorum TaxID=134537 RepID=UPI0038BBE00A